MNSEYFRTYAKLEAEFIAEKMQLKPGMKLLDVPCGAGRHSREFARNGLEVTAIDINAECLKSARMNCKGLQVKTAIGDMKDLKRFKGQFDAVTNLFTSFGYFETDLENEAVLRQFIAALKPGGKLALHLINRDWLMKRFNPADWTNSGSILQLNARKYDPKTKCIETQMMVLNQKTGRAKSYYYRHRLYSKAEVVALMKKCGLVNIKVYPAASAESFSKQKNSHPLYIGQKR